MHANKQCVGCVFDDVLLVCKERIDLKLPVGGLPLSTPVD
jgi:hypothetical protein